MTSAMRLGAIVAFARTEQQTGKDMTRLITIAVLVGLLSPVALAQAPKKHLLIYRTEHDAKLHCDNDDVVWASTKSHLLYLPGDKHYAHTHGGYVCESKAIDAGYHAPKAHT
jgi:hypothetical protein